MLPQSNNPTFLFSALLLLLAFTASSVSGDDNSAVIVSANDTSVTEPVCVCVDSSSNGLALDSPASFRSSSVTSEIFEVSTRHLPNRFQSISFEQPNVEVNQWVGNRWVRTDADRALPDGNSGMLTIIYVHGNFMERNNALERVRIVDGYLKSKATRPYRLVMLSWPSQRERKPLRDVLSNANSAECESLYIAWMLHRLRNEPQVSLLGFSFGARAVTGGLHLDAGGQLPGFSSPISLNIDRPSDYRVGLVAPAIDRHWLETNGRHEMALTHVDSMINMYNSRDPILRRFRFLDRLSRPIAAGFAGFTGLESLADPRSTSPLSGQTRIRQYDCGSVIGTTHSERSYYGECPYFRYIIQHVLWTESSGTPTNVSTVP